jgi:hypothetical protein
LIAEHLAHEGSRRTPFPQPAWQLEAFDRWPGFREELVRSLLLASNRALERGSPTDGTSGERAFQNTLALVPAAWRSTVMQLDGRSETRVGRIAELDKRPQTSGTTMSPAALASHHCRSCSVSLDDAGNRGISDRYCRYCADEEGRLKPRAEVQRLIAAWLADWQGDLPPDEALERAALFMQAMPAWSEN